MFTIKMPRLSRGATPILPECRLHLRADEVLGVVGPNGAGKSTVLASIAGLGVAPATVLWEGRALGRREIGFLPQAFAVRARLSVTDCLLLGRREALGLRVAPAMIAEAAALLARLGLEGLADRAMIDLSGGQQQRVLIAQRLFRNPRLLVLDEPTSALDLHHQLEVMEVLRRHVCDAGAPAIVALHDLTLAARYCDRLLVLAGGRLAAEGAPARALSADCLRDTWRVDPEILSCRDGGRAIIAHRLVAHSGAE